MCRFLAYWGEKPAEQYYWLVEAKNSLLRQSEKDNSQRPNPDGWGFAYRLGNEIILNKNPLPAFSDKKFVPEARKLQTDLLFAHVRRKSYGTVCLENTHPFLCDNWIFMHNGNIPNLDRFKRKLVRFLPDVQKVQTSGTTDSEFLFKYFLHWFQKNKNCDIYCVMNIIFTIIQKVIKMTEPEDRDALALNFMLTNGDYLIGYRQNRSMHYIQREKEIIIASEPLDEKHCWNEIPDKHFLICTRPDEVKLAALDVVVSKQTSFSL